jgi:Ca-activated chloride channel homolog
MSFLARRFLALVGMLAVSATPAATQEKSLTAKGCTAGPADAASSNQKIGSGRILKTEAEMTLVNVSVTDPAKRIVTGLERENFRIFENGVEQEILKFTSEDVPVSIGVIFDSSESMTDKIHESQFAALQFLRKANPQDEFFLVDFNDRAHLVRDFTDSVDDLQNYLKYAAAHGETALYDGVYLGLSQMRGAQHPKKALLIVSDGGDNHSRYSGRDVRRFAEESDVQIYTLGIFENGRVYSSEELSGPFLLYDLTEVTGGDAFTVHNLNELPDIVTKISMELRNQYVVGYHTPDCAHDGKWRKIKVKLRPPKGLPPLNVQAKSGYFAPSH